MNPFRFLRRHPEDDLSAYADGQIPPRRADEIASHLAACERCRSELEGLLDVRAALADLPEAAVPRSFALTPAMAAKHEARREQAALPSFIAMRVAGAGFAAALAVLIVLDTGGVINEAGRTGGDSAPAIGEVAERDTGAEPDAPYDADGALDIGGDDQADAPDSLGGGADDDTEDGARPGAITAPTAAPGDPLSPPDVPITGGDEETGGTIRDLLGDGDEPEKAAGEDGAAADDSGESIPETGGEITGEGGVDTLLVFEIGLAALALLAVAGSFLLRGREAP